MNQEAEENLQTNIQNWLDQKPGRDDILEYVKHLPENDKYILEITTKSYARVLYARLNKYFTENGISDFAKVIKFPAQLDFLEWINNTKSIPDNLLQKIQEEYPKVSINKLPSNIIEWVSDFFAKWHSNLYLATADEYFLLAFYLHSFVVGFTTADQIQDLATDLKEIYLNDGRKFDLGENYSTFELEKIKNSLKKLKFLPDDYIEKMLTGRDIDRSIFLFQMLTVLYFLRTVDFEQSRSDLEKLKLQLWDYLCALHEKKYLIEIESIRMEPIYNENQTKTDRLVIYLDGLWTKENIISKKTEYEMLSYISKLNPSQKKFLDLMFASYIRDLPLLNILFPPGAIDYILNLVINSASPVGVENISESLNKAIPDVNKHKLVTQLLQTIYEVTEALKPSNIHLTNHYV